jgi:hypothetical protein
MSRSLPPIRVGMGDLSAAATTTGQAAFSGAVFLGVVGAVYGAVTAPKAYREHDAVHYGILGAAVGGIAAALLTAPTAATASTSG